MSALVRHVVREEVPTHAEVADVLDMGGMHQVAAMVRDNEDLCWGDLLYTAQLRFHPRDVATAMCLLRVRWARHMRLTWCPLDAEVTTAYERAGREQAVHDAERTWWRRLLHQDALHGSMAAVHDVWRIVRRRWQVERGVGPGSTDDEYLDTVVAWLKER